MNTNPNAKVILCFGDSNTWGNIPRTDQRYPADIRWPGVLQNLLGDNFEVVEEGLCGRTFVAEHVGKPWKTGITHLKAILNSHEPLHEIIVMLGTNDVKDRYKLSAFDIAQHLQQTIDLVHTEAKDTRIIVICPPAIVVPYDGVLEDKIKRGVEIFKELPALFKEVARVNNCLYIDAGDYISLENSDGFHLDQEAHAKLGERIAQLIKAENQ